MTSEPDEIMVRMSHGVELPGRGERDAARRVLSDVWQEIGPEGDAFHRCAAVA